MLASDSLSLPFQSGQSPLRRRSFRLTIIFPRAHINRNIGRHLIVIIRVTSPIVQEGRRSLR